MPGQRPAIIGERLAFGLAAAYLDGLLAGVIIAIVQGQGQLCAIREIGSDDEHGLAVLAGGLNAHSDGERFGLRLWFPGELVVFHDDFDIGLPCVCGIVCGVGPDFDAYYLVCVERDGCILRGRLYVRESGVAQLGNNTVQVLTLAI